jgi:putative aldouronate transport system substrate-binding protein
MQIRKATNRREFLRLSAVGAGAVLLDACAQPAPPTPTSAPAPTPAPPPAAAPTAAPTQAPAKPTEPSAPAPKPTSAPTAAPTAAAAKPTASALPSAGNILPPELMPGSPSRPKGWATILPPLPKGMPAKPVITITSSRRTDQGTKFAKGDTLDNSPFTRMVKEAFGIEWKVAWTWVTADDALQKYNLAMASGQLPDLMETVPTTIFVQMLQANLLKDITDVYDAEADPEIYKKPLEYGDGLAWSYAQVKGRKYGIPRVALAAQDDKILWIRQDWLEKLRLSAPATLDELANVAREFVKAQLGQGASGTTVGLNFGGKDSMWGSWYSSVDPIFGAHGVMPGSWTKEGDGLMLDTIRPQVKEPLAVLAQWYKERLIPEDYFSRDSFDAAKRVQGNQAGLHFSPFFAASFGGLDSVKNDPNARWMFARIPSGPSGKRGTAWTNPFRPEPFCFRKGTDDKVVAAVIQQGNWLAELTQNPERRFHGWEGYQYEWEGDTVKPTDIGWNKWFFGTIGGAGGGGTDPLREYKLAKAVEEWTKIPKEKRDAWQIYATEDPMGLAGLGRRAQIHIVDHMETDGIKNLFTTLPTPTIVSNQATLQKLEREAYANIITGQKPVSSFDEFVAQYRRLGGDKIMQEVNEWWKSRAK